MQESSTRSNNPNVAELVVDRLIDAGLSPLFCLPGVQNDDFFDALFDRQAELPPIHTRHEQGAAYMALGAALATGKPQVFCVVPGPGFLNATAALSTAWAVGAPVLALVGQVPSAAIGKGFGFLHELPDQLSILRGLTKWAGSVGDGEQAATVIDRALRELKSGRPRPVGLEVPVDIWKQMTDNAPEATASPSVPSPDAGKIAAAADRLLSAKRPMIVAGSGALDAAADVQRLAEALDAPVLTMRTGHGAIPHSHDLSVTGPAGYRLWAETDVVLAVGTRLQQRMLWGMDDGLDVIHIDIDAEELNRTSTPFLGIEADIALALPALNAELEGRAARRPDWRVRVDTVRSETRAALAADLAPQIAWLSAIRRALPPEGIFVEELTQMGYVARTAFPVHLPRTYLSPGYQGTLGWGFATALGAAHVRRDVPVVAISGDGGALYTISELATAVHHKIPITLVVFSDNAFGNVRRFQIENYNNRAIASDLTSPDFVALAESFGAKGVRADTPEALEARIRDSISDGGVTVIEVPVGDFPSPWKHIIFPKIRGVA